MSIALKTDQTCSTLSHFLQLNFPALHSIGCNPIILKEQLLLSDKTTPICLLLNTTDDPSEEIQKLAMHVGLTNSKLKFHALHGNGLNEFCEWITLDRLLHTAGVRGQWLVLQNIEQNEKALTCCTEYLNKSSQNIHNNFRLWLTVKGKAEKEDYKSNNDGEETLREESIRGQNCAQSCGFLRCLIQLLME